METKAGALTSTPDIKDIMIPEQGIVIQNITVRPVQRKSQDIQNWRNALKNAETINGRRVDLYDLYEDLQLDGVLSDLIEKRILGVTKNRLQFVNKDGSENEAISELLKLSTFRTLRKEVQLQKFWGIKAIELSIKDGKFHVYSIPVKHIRPKEGLIVLEQAGSTGYAYRQPPYNKYVLEVGKYDDLGLTLKSAPYVIYKRGGFGDWAEFATIFGMPFREARYDGYNDVVRQQLIQALESAGSAGYAVLPREAELTIHENKNNQGSSQLYNDLRKACNEELAILILGQSQTTQKTTGSLGGNDDTHEQTEDDINLNDREDELCIFNEKVKPILANLGYAVEGGEFKHKQEEEVLTKKEQVDVIKTVKNDLKVPVDDDYIYEITGIPKPADYDAQKQKIEAAAFTRQNEPSNGNKRPKNKQQKQTTTTEQKLAWIDKLRITLADFFDPAP